MPLFPENDPCFSLPRVLCAIAKRSGGKIEFDDVVAAMGLGWLICAAPNDPDIGNWMMYARDAFLIPAARLFGMTIREMHPPEAARGVDCAAEFGQHFDASYRPLILRALENDQSVIAWRGWDEDRALYWGDVQGECEDGVGFRGTLHEHFDAQASPQVLIAPPAQVYVVETMTPIEPDRQMLFQMVSKHLEQATGREIEKRFGIVVGPKAFDLWNERLAKANVEDTVEHAQFHASVIACHQIAQRWLQKNLAFTARLA